MVIWTLKSIGLCVFRTLWLWLRAVGLWVWALGFGLWFFAPLRAAIPRGLIVGNLEARKCMTTYLEHWPKIHSSETVLLFFWIHPLQNAAKALPCWWDVGSSTGPNPNSNPSSLVHWFIGSLVHWFIGSLVHWFIGSLVHWFIRLSNSKHPFDWFNDLLLVTQQTGFTE